MISQEVHVQIDRPVSEVYDFVIRNYVETHPKFDPDSVSTMLDGGGAMAQGKTGREVRKQMGRENTYTFRITELTDDHVRFDAESGSTKFGAVWSVRPADGGTDLGIRYQLGFGIPSSCSSR